MSRYVTEILADDDHTPIRIHGAYEPPRLPEDCGQAWVDDAFVAGRPRELTDTEEKRAIHALVTAHEHHIRSRKEDRDAAWEANHAD